MKTKFTILNGFWAVVLMLVFALVFSGCDDFGGNKPNPDEPEPKPKPEPIPGGLPVISIDTNNSAPIADRENWVTMTFSLSDPANPENDIPPLSNQQIRGRGNSTWSYESGAKNPYRIRFRDNQQQSPFGLRAARNWVLLKTGDNLNNSFGFELGKRLGLEYTCTYRHVQLYLNGDYRGIYMFTEHRQADPSELGAPGRPKVDPVQGWFVEIDRYFDEDPKFRTENRFDLPIMVKSPDAGTDIWNPVYNIVRDDWNYLTNLMDSDSFPENDYRGLVDIDTFVKYFIVQTVVLNCDLFRPRAETGEEIGSTFFYKDKDGLISAGPIWDLDWSFSPWEFEGREFNPDSLPYQIHPWFSRFHDDPVFQARYKEIWNNNYQNNILTMTSFVDNLGAEIRDGVIENFERWGYPNNYPDHFDWHVWHINDFFSVRAEYLNTEYNKVDVLPTDKNFGTADTVSPQTFTLVSFGEMTELSATLQKGDVSPFEVVAPLNQTPAGDGGFLAVISVRPKASLPAGPHTDVLVLSGKNQGQSFTHNVQLTYK